MHIIPIQTERVEIHPEEKITEWILKKCEENEYFLQEGDILVLSSKIVSYFENRVLDYHWIKPSEKAQRLSIKMNTPEQVLELVLLEADEIVAETKWVLLTRKNGILCANSGIDTSNVPKGHVVLWPKDPFRSAMSITSQLQEHTGLQKLGMVIADSNCLPGRSGTTAVAIGYFGIGGFQDLKGSEDSYGNILRYSALNRVDSLATAANLVMGESNEQCPIAIIRKYKWEVTRETKNDEMIISSSDDLYPF